MPATAIATQFWRPTWRYRICTPVTAIDTPAMAIAFLLRRSACCYRTCTPVTASGLLFQQSASRFDNPFSVAESGTPNTGIGLPFWLPAFVDSCRRMRFRIPRTDVPRCVTSQTHHATPGTHAGRSPALHGIGEQGRHSRLLL
jgi:hypothetical protein